MNANTRRRALILIALACVPFFAATTSVRAQQGQSQLLPVSDVDKLHRLIKPQVGEARWMEIDWHPTIWEARQKAAAEGKPLFLWAGSGGAPPAGC